MFDLLPYYWMKVALAFGVLLALVPLAGLLTLGSWRQAWRYTLAWARSILVIVAFACVLAIILLPFILFQS